MAEKPSSLNSIGLLEQMLAKISLSQLKWLSVALPLLFLTVYYYFMMMVEPTHYLFHSIGGFLALILVLAIAVTAFSTVVFGTIGRMQGIILNQNQRLAKLGEQLRSLNEAGAALSSEMLLPSVLQRIADLSRQLLGARYAALAVLGADGAITEFVTSGLDQSARQIIGRYPTGKGLLGAILGSSEPMRVDDIRRHPDSIGFPPGHPEMTTLIAAPILYKGRVLGGLYLADKGEGSSFTSDDEEILKLFAAQAAIAIENARLYQEVQSLAVEQERSRIAREMHDGLAQVLTYLNAKVQAVNEFLEVGRPDAAQVQLRQLAEAARGMYADVREGILALRTQLSEERGLIDVLKEYMIEFEAQSGIETRMDCQLDPNDLHLEQAQEIQLLRIVQEALTNVRKHSGATRTIVTFRQTEGRIEITISDNGRGFNPSQIERRDRPHFGLQTMQERAEAIGAEFQVQSAESEPGQGTKVILALAEARVRAPG